MKTPLTKRVLEPSGLPVYHAEVDAPVTHVQVWTPFGSDRLNYRDAQTGREVRLQPGSAHYFEHLLFNENPLKYDKSLKARLAYHGINMARTVLGNKRSDALRIPKRRIGSGMSVLKANRATEVNAFTFYDTTNYWFLGNKRVLENTGILTSMVLDLHLPEWRFKEEAGAVVEEEEAKQDILFTVLVNRWHAQAFHETHGAHFPVIGTPETIVRTSYSDVVSLFKTFYTPSQMTVVVTGRVDIDQVCEVITQQLERLGRNIYQTPPQEIAQQDQYGVREADNFGNPIQRADIKRPMVFFGWKRAVDPTELSLEENIRLQLASRIAGTGLFGEGTMQREELIAQGIDDRTFGADTLETREHALVYGHVDTEDPQKTREIIQGAASKLRSDGLSQNEFDYARNVILLAVDTANMARIASNLGKWAVTTGDPASYHRFIDLLENVKPGDIQDCFDQVLNPDNFSMVLAEPK